MNKPELDSENLGQELASRQQLLTEQGEKQGVHILVDVAVVGPVNLKIYEGFPVVNFCEADRTPAEGLVYLEALEIFRLRALFFSICISKSSCDRLLSLTFLSKPFLLPAFHESLVSPRKPRLSAPAQQKVGSASASAVWRGALADQSGCSIGAEVVPLVFPWVRGGGQQMPIIPDVGEKSFHWRIGEGVENAISDVTGVQRRDVLFLRVTKVCPAWLERRCQGAQVAFCVDQDLQERETDAHRIAG